MVQCYAATAACFTPHTPSLPPLTHSPVIQAHHVAVCRQQEQQQQQQQLHCQKQQQLLQQLGRGFHTACTQPNTTTTAVNCTRCIQ